jgi:hypothetical protein
MEDFLVDLEHEGRDRIDSNTGCALLFGMLKNYVSAATSQRAKNFNRRTVRTDTDGSIRTVRSSYG